MGKEHDSIIYKLNKKKLLEIFKPILYKNIEVGVWSDLHFAHEKECEDWTFDEIYRLYNKYLEKKDDYDKNRFNSKLKIYKSIIESEKKYIENANKEDNDVILQKTIEFPIIKGEGQYKTTKGFIDLIIHFSTNKNYFFKCHEKIKNFELLCEIKKEKDFEDIGSIIRQIKEYREYYYVCKRWKSEIINQNYSDQADWRENQNLETDCHYSGNTGYSLVIVADKIPEMAKEMLDDEKIMYIELDKDE